MQHFGHAVGLDGRGAGRCVDVYAINVQPIPGFGGDVFIVAGGKGVVVDDREEVGGVPKMDFKVRSVSAGPWALFTGSLA